MAAFDNESGKFVLQGNLFLNKHTVKLDTLHKKLNDLCYNPGNIDLFRITTETLEKGVKYVQS